MYVVYRSSDISYQKHLFIPIHQLTEISFKTSSRTSTGALRYNTAFHSIQFKGVMEKSDCESMLVTNQDQGEITHREERHI